MKQDSQHIIHKTSPSLVRKSLLTFFAATLFSNHTYIDSMHKKDTVLLPAELLLYGYFEYIPNMRYWALMLACQNMLLFMRQFLDCDITFSFPMQMGLCMHLRSSVVTLAGCAACKHAKGVGALHLIQLCKTS